MKHLLVVVVLLVLVVAAPVFAENPPPYLMQWGTYGSGPGQFNNPYGIAVSGEYVFIVDRGNNRIQKFTTEGQYVREWGQYGADDGDFNGPYGIAVDPQGYVYVTDEYNHRIQKFTGDGDFVLKWGTNGIGPSSFPAPHGCAYGSGGIIAIVHGTTNGNVQRWTTDGQFLFAGISGSCVGVCMLPSGREPVSYPTCRIQVWINGVEYDFGSCGSGPEQMNDPGLLAGDASENIYVAEQGNNRIHKFTYHGQHIMMWGVAGTGNGEFNGPMGVALGADGRVYVTDSRNNRIQVFGEQPTAVQHTSWGTIKSLFR